MIDWIQAIWLALIQGLTEFLPISSSAHLVIPSLILQWPDQGLAFDVAVHVGTLTAVVAYYRVELLTLARGTISAIGQRRVNEELRMVTWLGVASIPVAITGFVAGDFVEDNLRSLPVIAATTLLFGVLLGYADRYTNHLSQFRTLALPAAIIIGFAQMLAIMPGVSRSGITITAALLLNLDRHTAARFSFLLSIPVIAGAGSLKGWELSQAQIAPDWWLLGTSALVAAITAYACIAVFLRLLDRVGLMPFVYYRVVLSVVLLGLWFWQ